MPELPEVETVVRALARTLAGRRLETFRVSGLRLRAPVDAGALRREIGGRAVVAVRRRAKYILIEVEGARALLVHLGMTGSLALADPATAPGRHDHVRVTLDNGTELRFTDPRRFGQCACLRLAAPGADPDNLRHLGPEPLSRAFGGRYLYENTRGRRRPIKPLVLDQGFVVGVGNIYASEALFRAGIHPERSADSLTRDEADRLAAAIKTVLRAAIRAGGTTFRDFKQLSGAEGLFQRALRVYDRAGLPCPACGAAIQTFRQAGRSTFFCPTCQPVATNLRLARD